jgi:hypothetical protein
MLVMFRFAADPVITPPLIEVEHLHNCRTAYLAALIEAFLSC